MAGKNETEVSDEEIRDLLAQQGVRPEEMTHETIDAYRQSLVANLD